ncbi:MAG: hypothetical protein HZA49_00485 [Planctomycetes bacterium]|nr:hypothetical protein [Planctomycetota bacterium]
MKNKKSISVLAGLFIIAGMVLVLENYALLRGISQFWPGLILITGSGFVLLFFSRHRQDPALIWLGSFMVALSIFFLCLNNTAWATLSYLWPVFLGIVGLSFLVTGIFVKGRTYAYLAVFFISVFLALYFVFTVSLKLWPLSMVLFGISLLIIDYFNTAQSRAEEKENVS